MAKDKKLKTNAMRILDSKKVSYEMLSYESEDGKIDGISVAHKIGIDEKNVFKTLVAQGTSKELYVFVIPVAEELDLKNAAKIAGEKKVEMIAVKDILKYTGYIRGGCSPIGMKKNYKTFIHESAEDLDFIIFSAGKIGHQIKMNPKDLLSVVEGEFAFLIK
ncbi:Cys-tRNA(Pro) deacylase [Clostridium perfringens]|uniref:Cys-tRNA(Pro) deacylase n=1 Tax=Clostridium perfringens TaxID=1502 RepID=UPI001ABBA59D|nr:Cys-tRNA(Pro) deacylase [Clostridium perfringens]MBO3375826.1 Cys-tRNA(Pro) deacylase [Clostridium perfringens]